ncbi:GNAT family N-acetyltransferase [Diaphorobacter sp.]|uniref:GNAT family N-acetyltransferase n=1 Tax=Diaphorobacter sp. TaxID=1934310 RepID=UPI003D117C1D
MTLKIRNETASDVAAIEAVTIAAFHDAEHTSHTEHFIVNALRHAGQLTLSLVADDDGAVVGHVAISPIRLSIGPADWFGLGPLSVLPQRQRQGIGVQLMNLNRPGFCRQSRASYFLSNRSPYEQSTLPRRIQDRGGQTNP